MAGGAKTIRTRFELGECGIQSQWNIYFLKSVLGCYNLLSFGKGVGALEVRHIRLKWADSG